MCGEFWSTVMLNWVCVVRLPFFMLLHVTPLFRGVIKDKKLSVFMSEKVDLKGHAGSFFGINASKSHPE